MDLARTLDSEVELTEGELSSLLREFHCKHCTYCYGSHEVRLPGGLHDSFHLRLKVTFRGQGVLLRGEGRSLIDAAVDALGLSLEVQSVERWSVIHETRQRAVVLLKIGAPRNRTAAGVGVHTDVDTASLKAFICAADRALEEGIVDDAMGATITHG